MTIDEIQHIINKVNQDYISYSDKCEIVNILKDEQEHLEWLNLFNTKGSEKYESRACKV